MRPRAPSARVVAGAAVAALLAAGAAVAHESRPAYLEVRETAPGTFTVLWRTPVLAGMPLPVAMKLPGSVRDAKERLVQQLSDSVVERRWIEAGPDGLAGKRIEFPGLQLTITDVLVRMEMRDGRTWTTVARPSRPWIDVAAAQSWWGLVGTYVAEGVRHILEGYDHLAPIREHDAVEPGRIGLGEGRLPRRQDGVAHAELEGGRLISVFEQLLAGWKAQGWSLGPVRALYDDVEPLALPRCENLVGTVEGRSGTLLVQGDEFLGDAHGREGRGL